MSIPRATIDEIRDRTDIVAVIEGRLSLKRAGRNFTGLCPFHDEKTPSFNVSPERQRFICFGCGETGDVFDFLQKIDGTAFVQCIKDLAAHAGIVIEERELTQEQQQQVSQRRRLLEVNDAAASWFHARLLTDPLAQSARDYLEGRGFGRETIESARLGFAPDSYDALINHLHSQGFDAALCIDAGLAKRSERGSVYATFRNRVQIPILDRMGRPIAFGGRLLGDEKQAKYINSPETDIYSKSSVLYGLSWARPAVAKHDRLLLVEGYFDVLSLHQAGFKEAVATCGTALTRQQAQEIKRLTQTVIAVFDMDEAGERAGEKALSLFLDCEIEPRHLLLPDAKDPDEFIQRQGAEAFQRQLDKAQPLLLLSIRRSIRRHGRTPGGRSQAVAEIAPLLRRLPGIHRSEVLIQAANLLGVAESALREMIGRSHRSASPPAKAGGWRGTKELNHLLWLLLHHPAASTPVFDGMDLALISDREDVQRALQMLVEGSPFQDTLEAIEDRDLRFLLQATDARPDLYEADQAAPATRQILDQMKQRPVQEELDSIGEALLTLDTTEDREEIRRLLVRRQQLQTLIESLSLVAREQDLRGNP